MLRDLRGVLVAEHIVCREMNARMDEAMNKLRRREMTLPEIDALPEQWRLIAAERCYLWSHPDGTYSVREDR